MSWQPTAALARVTVLPIGLALLAVLARRPDLLVLAAPLALAALALTGRPPGRPDARLTAPTDVVAEGDDVRVTLAVHGAAGAQTAAFRLRTADWVRPARQHEVTVVARPPAVGSLAVDARLVAARWGRSDVGPGVLVLSACGGLLRAGPDRVPARRIRVLPLSARYDSSPLVPRARDAVGLHRSSRLGEGSELAGIRPFAPGDRFRRINWRTSLRTGDLQVNATTTERDAAVQLLLDARYDAGTSGGVHAAASGVDIAVRAAAALADFYLRLGDRVGLVTFTATARVLSARAGRGQRARLLDALLSTAAPAAVGVEPRLAAPPNLDPRALVFVVSPLVGRYVFEQVGVMVRAGHTVVVIDTLPVGAVPDDPDPWTSSATAIWLLERSTRIGQLRAIGAPVVPWQGSRSLDAVLAELARANARTRARR